MVRPTGWEILGLDGDPTPGVVESVQTLAKQFGDFAHDVESAYSSLNSFGADATALEWVGKTAEAFKGQFGPLPGRLQKLYISYSEASDALSAYTPALAAAQSKADSALRQAQDAHTDLQRAQTNANTAASDLKTAQQNHAASPNPQAVTDAQTAHDTAQTGLKNAQDRMAALTAQAHQAAEDLEHAAGQCAKALGHAQSDGIHNKHWWEHVGEFLSEWGGEVAEIANDVAPFLDVLAPATSWIPGVDVITAGLGTGIESVVSDAMQGHSGDVLLGVGMLGLQFVGGKLLGKLGGEAEGDVGGEARAAEGAEGATLAGDPVDVVSGQMITATVDLSLDGVLPLVLQRTYASGYGTGRLFGPGWASTLDQRLSLNEAGIHVAGDDAERLDYPIPAADEPVFAARGARRPLVWDRAADEIRIADPRTGHVRHFATVHFGNEFGQIRDLTAISDRNGNRVRILRDEFGTPTGLENAGYRVAVDSVVTAAGPRVVGLRLLDGTPDGVTVKKYGYDERGRLTAVIDSTGLPYIYEHDDEDRITAWVDRVGYRYEYEYDQHGRVVRGAGDGGYLSAVFAYATADRKTEVTDSLGRTTVYVHDENGHIAAITDPVGGTAGFAYDRFGRLLGRRDALGNVTTFSLDEAGNTVRVVRPDDETLELSYNALNQITEARLPGGARWVQEYDERGNLVSLTDPAGSVTGYQYRGDGALAAVTDALGEVTRFEADAAGLPVAHVDPMGATGRVRRDAFGRPVSSADPLGAVIECAWTVEGLVSWRSGPNGARFEWTYDAQGQLLAQTDPVGAVTSYEPGPFGHTASRIEPNGDRFVFDFDSELNLMSVTNTAGAQWSYAYDLNGRLVSEIDFIGRRLDYGYDVAGRLTRRTDSWNRETVLTRDALGRVVHRATPDGDFSYVYDAAGQLSCAEGPGTRVEFARDAAGRVVSESVDGRVSTYSYDLLGRCVRRVTPTGAESGWDFDAAGRPLTLSTGAGALGFTHDAAGNEIERRFGAGARLTRGFDAGGRLASLRLWTEAGHGEGAAALLDRFWSYQANGLPVEIRDSALGTRRFTNDLLGRVTAVTAESWTESYAYDGFGNVITVPAAGSSAAAELAAADGAEDDEPVSDGTLVRSAARTSYDHDAAGRVVRAVRRTLDGRRKVWDYTWDADDRLIKAATPDGSVWRYRYDALGRRTVKERLDAAGQTVAQVVFVWEGSRLAEQHEHRPDGATTVLTWDYEPGTFRPATQTRRAWAADADQDLVDEALHAIVTDLVGTPTELVDSEGRVVWRTVASLWGSTIATAVEDGSDCPLRFPGQYHDDETDLDYNFHRYYDPVSAAYLSPDPLGLAPSPNDHGYVDNPLVWSDPLGLAGCPLTRMEPTQSPDAGGIVPKSFNYTAESGTTFWVHPNATKHLIEETQGLTFGRLAGEQVRLRSLGEAIDAATRDGIPEAEKMTVSNGWELIFSAPRKEGLNPVVKQARHLGGGV
jgi:RHS repeat-associated protein